MRLRELIAFLDIKRKSFYRSTSTNANQDGSTSLKERELWSNTKRRKVELGLFKKPLDVSKVKTFE